MISKNMILLIFSVISLVMIVSPAYADDDDYAKQENRIDELFEKLEKLLIEQEVIAEELRGYGIFADDDTEALEEWQLKDDSPSRTKRCADDCPKTMKIRAAYEYPRWCIVSFCNNQHVMGAWSPNINALSPEVDVDIDVIAERNNITPYAITSSETKPVKADYQIFYRMVDDNLKLIETHDYELHSSHFKWYDGTDKFKENKLKQSIPEDSIIKFILTVDGLR